MQTADDKPVQIHNHRAWRFWLAFWLAYLPGILILDIIDDVLHMRLTGNHNDGEIIFLSFYLSPLFAAAAALIKAVWKRYDSIGFAVAFAILAPLFAYLSWFIVG